MAEIGLELNRIRQISDEIKSLDETLISRYFNELYGILNGIESTVNQDDNVFGTVGRITRNADNIAQKLGSSLKSLENFIDTQLEDYSRNENTAYDRLRAVLERMAKLLGLDVKSLKIDSPSTVVNPTVSGGSSPSYVTPAAAAMGAGALGTMGYAGGQFLSDAQRDALMRQAEMEGRIRDAYNVSNSVTPEPITYPADSIPSLTKEWTVGPDGHYLAVWVGEDNRIYDENGDLMTSMYMTKNGAIVETSAMESFINMSEKDRDERYRWLYANQNGLRYEQVKDEYLTPEFKAKCDSQYIDHYMPANGTDLDVAKEFRQYANSSDSGISGNDSSNGIFNDGTMPATGKGHKVVDNNLDSIISPEGGKAEAHDTRNTPSNGSVDGDIVNLPGNPNEKPKVNNLPGNPNKDVEVTPLSNRNEVSSIPHSSNSGGQVASNNGGSSVANNNNFSSNNGRGTAHGALGKEVNYSDLSPSAPTNSDRSVAASSIFGTDAYVKGNTVVDKNGKTLGSIRGNTIFDTTGKPVAVGTPNGMVAPASGGTSATAGLTKSTAASNVFGEDAYVKGNTFVDKNGNRLGSTSGNAIVDKSGKTIAVATPNGMVAPASGGTSATAGLTKSTAASTVFGKDAYVKGNTFVDKNGNRLGSTSGNAIVDTSGKTIAVATPNGIVSPTTGGSSASAGSLSHSEVASRVYGTDAYVTGNTVIDKNGRMMGMVNGNAMVDTRGNTVAVGTPNGVVSTGPSYTGTIGNTPSSVTPSPAAIKSNIPGKGSSTGSYSGIAQLFQ